MAGSIRVEGMDVLFLCMLCRYWSLRLADHSFRGVLLCVCNCVCVCVCVCKIVCDIETATMRRPSPELGCCGAEKMPGGNEENSETPLSGQTVFQMQNTCVIDCAGLLCGRSP
jgi:hypothetical protein